jgi:hypothetical protein
VLLIDVGVVCFQSAIYRFFLLCVGLFRCSTKNMRKQKTRSPLLYLLLLEARHGNFIGLDSCQLPGDKLQLLNISLILSALDNLVFSGARGWS